MHLVTNKNMSTLHLDGSIVVDGYDLLLVLMSNSLVLINFPYNMSELIDSVRRKNNDSWLCYVIVLGIIR